MVYAKSCRSTASLYATCRATMAWRVKALDFIGFAVHAPFATPLKKIFRMRIFISSSAAFRPLAPEDHGISRRRSAGFRASRRRDLAKR